MNRRSLLHRLLLGAGGLTLGLRPLELRAEPYSGKFCVVIQNLGGWDVSSYCDPKVNQPGEREINHWANSAGVEQAGNIPYAPFGNNHITFEKYFDRTLIINGVDAQTGSHTAGVVHNFSGRITEGYPSLTALFAAGQAPDAALAYMNAGGYAETGGIIRYARVTDPTQLVNLADPTRSPVEPPEWTYVDPKIWGMVTRARDEQARALAGTTGRMPRSSRNRGFYQSALERSGDLRMLVDVIPPGTELRPPWGTQDTGYSLSSSLERQVQIALFAFKSGLSVAADVMLGGWDSHAKNDPIQGWLMERLNSSLDLLWETAEALGIADRLVVVVGSDFGRTPFYNDGDGKDHHPIGSYMIMEKNQPWTNRVVGETDGMQNAFSINPTTLQRDDGGGTVMSPNHVYKALRSYLGIGNSVDALRYPITDTEDFAFFT